MFLKSKAEVKFASHFLLRVETALALAPFPNQASYFNPKRAAWLNLSSEFHYRQLCYLDASED